VLLIASPAASASLILEKPEDVLNRAIHNFDPTPEFGPRFHFRPGREIIVYERPRQETVVADILSVWIVGAGFGLGLLFAISRCQRALLLFRLLD
jgi:hypothetical protein